MDSLRGQLLLASPAVGDPNFHRTVVLMVEHSDDGALGLVLNRASEARVDDAVPEIGELPTLEPEVRVGGPVQPTGLILLAELDDEEPSGGELGAAVVEGVHIVTADADLVHIGERAARVRVFAGHAGWGPGQLEAEFEREDWIADPASREDVFAEDPDELWSTVLERKGGQFALLARMPPDPSVN